jgi:hypothetical protein
MTGRKHISQDAAHALLAALEAARDHLDYCGYGDSWERECARAANLPTMIDNAIAKATGDQP